MEESLIQFRELASAEKSEALLATPAGIRTVLYNISLFDIGPNCVVTKKSLLENIYTYIYTYIYFSSKVREVLSKRVPAVMHSR